MSPEEVTVERLQEIKTLLAECEALADAAGRTDLGQRCFEGQVSLGGVLSNMRTHTH